MEESWKEPEKRRILRHVLDRGLKLHWFVQIIHILLSHFPEQQNVELLKFVASFTECTASELL